MPFLRSLAKFILRLLDEVVDFVLLTIIVCMIFLSGYSLWDAGQIYESAQAAQYEAFVPVEGDTRSFEELREMNPEVMGWLRVNDTSINYPLLQARDNQKYVSTDVEGNYSISGAIFLDYRANPDFSDFNNVVYGHHMEKNRMFGDIGLFTQKDYFDSHPYGNLFFDGKDHGIEFFAYVQVDAYDEIFDPCEENPESYQVYLDRIWEIAMYTREMDVTADDNLVLLSTCTTAITNGRNILIGRLTDTLYPEAAEEKFYGFGVDTLETPEGLPLWIWIFTAIILLLLILIIVLTVVQKRRKGRYARKRH